MTSDDVDEPEFDFWEARLGIPFGGYNSAVDQQIYDVAKLIVEAWGSGAPSFVTTIAAKLGLTAEHVELIQYILAGVRYPTAEGEPFYRGCAFDYGTSPRGLFVGNIEMARAFLAEFEAYLADDRREDGS